MERYRPPASQGNHGHDDVDDVHNGDGHDGGGDGEKDDGKPHKAWWNNTFSWQAKVMFVMMIILLVMVIVMMLMTMVRD